MISSARAAGDPPQQLDALIEEALDQTVKRIEISDQPLPDALGVIDKATGVRFALDPAVLELMPYGPKTRVSLLIESVPLRSGLQQMLDRLGLAMRVEKDRVRIDPSPPLARLGRRIAVAELRVLEKLAATPWPVSGDPPVAGEPPVAIQYMVDPARRPDEALRAAMAQAGPGPATRQLEAATAALSWVWMPEDSRIVVCPRSEYFRRRLEMPIDLSYQRVPLDILMLDLGRRADVPVCFEPGVLARVNATRRNVDLVERRTSPRQAFELLCGRTGLRYEVCDAGLRITGQLVTRSQPPPPPTAIPAGGTDPGGAANAAASRTAAPAEPVNASEPALPEFADTGPGPMMVRITVPIGAGGAMIEFLIPEDQLPPELRVLKESKLLELLAILRERTKEEPAAKP